MKYTSTLISWILVTVCAFPVLKALETNDEKPAQNSLQTSGDISLQCKSTPLHLAIGLVRALVEQGQDVGAVDCEGKTPRDIAGEGKIKGVIQLFPFETKTTNNRINETGCFSSALHFAVRSVNRLAEQRGSLEALDCQNLTPLDFVHLNSSKIVLALSRNIESTEGNLIEGCNRTSLHLAVIEKDLNKIQNLLEMKPNMYATDCEGITPVDLAIVDNNHEAILLFMKAQFDLNRNSLHHLRLAVNKGSEETVKLLLDLGINKSTVKNYISEHLMEALLLNKSHMVQLLIKEGAQIDGSKYIQQFSEEGNVQGLLELKKMNLLTSELVNTVNDKNETPLRSAVKGNYAAVINILLANGANATNCGENGKTCLHFAIENHRMDALKALLGSGLSVEMTDNTGISPMSLAFRNDDVDSMDILKNFGADHSKIIHKAAKEGKLNALIWLLNNNHSTEETGSDNFTPLHNAVRYCKLPVVKELLSRKANVHAVTKFHDTPLHWAAVCGNLEIVQELISHGADVNNKCEQREGWTALHLAARDGHLEIVKELLLNRADINALNKVGHSPLYYAIAGKHNKVVDYLRSRNGRQV